MPDGTRERNLLLRSKDCRTHLSEMLEAVQANLFEKAKAFVKTNTHTVTTMEELASGLERDAGFYWVNWCGDDACENAFIGLKASIRAIPLEEDERAPTGPCINCGREAEARVLVAKSY